VEKEKAELDPDVPAQVPVSPARRLWIVGLAIALATLAALVAPTEWPSGPGRIEVSYLGLRVAEGSVEVGSTEAIEISGDAAGLAFEVALPSGVPLDAPTEATVRVLERGKAIRSDLGDIAIAITLSDGRVEPIPSVRFHDETLTLEARRRPPVDAAVVLALLAVVVVLWLSEFFPLFVTSLLIPVALVFSGVASGKTAMTPFFSPIIVLFFAGFLMAEAMRSSGLDRLAAIGIVAKAGKSPVSLFAAMLFASAFLSMWMSNTAAVAVLTPIAIAITEPLKHLGYRKAVVLGIAYAGTLGGVGSAIGTPGNQLAIELLDTFEVQTISFVEWFAYGMPVVVLLLPIIGLYLWKRMGVTVDADKFAKARATATAEFKATGRLNRNQNLVLFGFAAVVAGWLTQTMHGVHPGIVALAGTLALAAVGRIVPGDLQRIDWASLLTFGGGLTLGLFLVQTGASDWVATRLGSLAGMPPTLGVIIVAFIALALTSVASNTASAAILIPITIPLASVIGVDPVLLVVVVAIASSLDFALVIGTPPTMIAYSTHLYTASEIFRIGIVLDIIGVILLSGGVVWLWRLFGIV
jgi:sodium-dependent dicarboxylate transporter 2/3/5